jgi:hypothetical protein
MATRTLQTIGETATQIRRCLAEFDEREALHWVAQFVAEFKRASRSERERLVEAEPPATGDRHGPLRSSPTPPGTSKPAVQGQEQTTTSRVRGPWTPSTRLSSMSLVALGPLIQVSGRAGSRRATASGTVATTCPAVTTTRW